VRARRSLTVGLVWACEAPPDDAAAWPTLVVSRNREPVELPTRRSFPVGASDAEPCPFLSLELMMSGLGSSLAVLADFAGAMVIFRTADRRKEAYRGKLSLLCSDEKGYTIVRPVIGREEKRGSPSTLRLNRNS
jgi:hypothetical protein